MTRDFYGELKNVEFKTPITYSIYNKLEDDYIIGSLNKKYDDVFQVEDFGYYDFDLTDKEKFLLKMYNKEFTENLKMLKEKINDLEGVVLQVNRENGLIRVIKFNKVLL